MAAEEKRLAEGAQGRSGAALGCRIGPASSARPSASATALQVERARCGDTPHSTHTPEPPATDQGPDLLARPRSRRCR